MHCQYGLFNGLTVGCQVNQALAAPGDCNTNLPGVNRPDQLATQLAVNDCKNNSARIKQPPFRRAHIVLGSVSEAAIVNTGRPKGQNFVFLKHIYATT